MYTMLWCRLVACLLLLRHWISLASTSGETEGRDYNYARSVGYYQRKTEMPCLNRCTIITAILSTTRSVGYYQRKNNTT